MITSARHEILEKLATLSRLYPSMRLGQLVCFVSTIAEKESGLPRDVEDDAILAMMKSHLAKRTTPREGLVGADVPLSPTRQELYRTLEDLGNDYVAWRFGELVANLAALAHVNLYDVEDEQLLEVATANHPGVRWFEEYAGRYAHESTLKARCEGERFRCPCCHHLTLQERGGFEICPVCFWEDDGQDDADAETVRGGPNGALSLTEARENYLRHGTCDLKFVEQVRPPRLDEK